MEKNERMKAKTRLHKNEIKQRKGTGQKGDFAPPDDGIAKLRTAVFVLPFLIIGAMILILIIGINQYSRLFHEENGNTPNAAAVQDDDEEPDESDLLFIVSPDIPLPSDYKISLKKFRDIQVDQRITDSLDELLEAADKAGVSLKLTGGYISAEEQHNLYMAEVSKLVSENDLAQAKALEEAEKIVPSENHSEFQTGLAVLFGTSRADNFVKSDEYRWLTTNCVKYGFILRYPEGKEDSTEAEFDPCHFRYVGVTNAKQMRTLNLCLDEYVSYLNARN
ncbi:MAG: M15 family metallopeptidase [Clostridia bacterium]|nr:M15 family metallopeptidase [Clostridia bacterium]